MKRVADQFRLTVALFDDPPSLWSAMQALLQDGVQPDQLCLLALAETMPRLDFRQADGAAGNRNFDWLPPLQSLPDETGRRPIVATHGPLLDAISRIREASPVASAGTPASHHRLDLADHVIADAITLIVRSNTPAQQTLTARTLLSQSSHRVRTFEFAISRAA